MAKPEQFHIVTVYYVNSYVIDCKVTPVAVLRQQDAGVAVGPKKLLCTALESGYKHLIE
jgi:hypothetical protein